MVKFREKLNCTHGRISFKNRKLVNYVIQEYWDEICPVCKSSAPPRVMCSKDEFKLQIDLYCSNCSLTISYRKSHQIKNYRSSNSLNSINLSPNIFNNFHG